MREESAEREAEQAEALAESVRTLARDSAERVAKLEEHFAKERERASQQHWLTMLGAASRLDAVTLWREHQRWQLENKEREQGHQEALTEEQTALQEQLAY